MSSTSEEDLRRLLMDTTNRKIARYCEEPRTSAEIVEMVAYPDKHSDYHESLVSNSLRTLEAMGAISFSNGKWKTSPEVIAILKKYFGLK